MTPTFMISNFEIANMAFIWFWDEPYQHAVFFFDMKIFIPLGYVFSLNIPKSLKHVMTQFVNNVEMHGLCLQVNSSRK